jgi:peroxiredoxin
MDTARSIMRNSHLALFAATFIAALGLVAWGSHPAPEPPQARLDFTLKSLDGRDVALSSFKGRPLVSNFWEPFCVPCQHETPELVDLYTAHQHEGLVVVVISMHEEQDDVRAFVAAHKMTYPILLGGERDEIANAYAILGFPTTWFIRPDGTTSDVSLGTLSRAEMERNVLKTLPTRAR